MRQDRILSRQFYRRALALLVAASGFGVFTACQSTSSSPAPSGPEKREMIIADTFETDMAKWSRGGSDTGTAVLTGDSAKVVSLTLPTPLKGAVTLSLWSFGIRHTEIVCHPGKGSLLSIDAKSDLTPDSLGRFVISRLVGLHKIDSATYPATAAGLVKAYARDLVEGVASGFPVSRPVGIDSAAVVKAALLYANTKHQSFVALFSAKPKFLGLDTATVHDQILKLIGKGISSADSLVFFPLPPVRVKTAVKLEHDSLVNKGARVGFTGTFEADLSRGIGYIEVQVLDSNKVVDSGVSITNIPQPNGRASYDLYQQFYLHADSAKVGRHTVVIKALDKNRQDSAEVRLGLLILAAAPQPDMQGPNIILVDPNKLAIDTSTNTTSYLIKVKAEDSSGVDSVLIGDGPATLANGIWSRTVSLTNYGQNEFVIRSTDSKHNVSTKSVFISRALPAGAKGPSVVFLGASNKIKIPYDQKTIRLSWTVNDTAGIKSVEMNRQTIQPSSDTFSIEVIVPPTGDSVEYRLFAINKNLIGSENVVQVTRAKDQVAPVLAIDSASWLGAGAFTGDTLVVPTATTSLTLKWKATDNHYVRAVTLDGDTLAMGSDSLYSWKISTLPAGLTKATIIASDSDGNTKIAYAKLLRMDRVAISFSLDTLFIDSGYVKAVSPTPGATIEYSLDGTTWAAIPTNGIRLTGSASIQFRGRAPGFTEDLVTKSYVVKITPPPQAVGAVWNQFNWDDKLVVWQ